MIKTSQPALHGDQHLPEGSDPIPGFPPGLGTGDTLDNTILGLAPAGFWKLNESSGHIAADSSGFGQDLSTTSPELDPIWAQPAGPPGEQTADFMTGTDGLPGISTSSRVSRAWAALTTSFTAGIWVNRHDTSSTYVMGQGNPSRAGGHGWLLYLNGVGPGGKPQASIIGSPGGSPAGANTLAPDTWAFLAAVYDSTANTFKLYADGLLQDTATGINYSSPSSDPLWIGQDGGLGGNVTIKARFIGSYAFLFPVALTGAELLDIYDHAGTTGFLESGLVLTSNGFGASTWEEPTIRVSY